MPIPKSIEAACQQALSRFDFAKAASIYKLLEWKWQGAIPDEARIQTRAQELCSRLCETEGPSSTSTGGLIVWLERVECGWEVRIEFVAVSGISDDFQERAG